MSHCIASVPADASRCRRRHGGITHPTSRARDRYGPLVDAIFQEDGDSTDYFFQER